METVFGVVKGGILSDQVIKGDQTLWWVLMTKAMFTAKRRSSHWYGNQGQAFGFATNDEINNMTFYSYEIIKRSTFA